MRAHFLCACIGVLSLAAKASGACDEFPEAAMWHDSASDDWMEVKASGCTLQTRYGTAEVAGRGVRGTGGILGVRALRGEYSAALGRVVWANGMQWTRVQQAGSGGSTGGSSGTGSVDTKQFTDLSKKVDENTEKISTNTEKISTNTEKISTNTEKISTNTEKISTNTETATKTQDQLEALLKTVEELQEQLKSQNDRIQEFEEKVASLSSQCQKNCNAGSGTGNTSGTTSPDVSKDIEKINTRIDTLNATLSSIQAGGNQGGSNPGGNSQDIEELRKEVNKEITVLQEKVNSINVTALKGEPGRDGYCSVEPNVTSTYVPIVRYVRRAHKSEDVCSTGGGWPSRGLPGSGTTPGMGTVYQIDPNDCSWSANMRYEPTYAYKGDSLVFHRTDRRYNIWKMKNEQAWKACNFDGAELLAGLLDLEGLESQGKNFTLTLDTAGEYYFASDTSGKTGDERKEYCWHKDDGDHPTMGAGWGKGVKFRVNVVDPIKEVMAECPLYDPSKYGVSNNDQQVDSASVEKLKGVVSAIGRQLISNEVRTQERVRAEGNSGVTVTRSRWQGTDAYYQESYVGSGPANCHNHADYKYTIGMGEFGAVLNGVQFNTRHNDYSMVQPDDTATVEEYHGEWPPPSREIEFPEVPDSVLNKKNVNDQIREMREYFRAFHTQNSTHRDYKKHFRPVLCYLEATWAEEKDEIAEPFKSERHQIDADNWNDLNQKVNFLFNNGQKVSNENLPYLPTSFRAMGNGEDSETYEPKIAQWFYRINCVPIKEDVPTSRFRVRNDLHIQLGKTKPATREQVAETTRAMFDVNPVRQKDYADGDSWPKEKTEYEYIDELMATVPGFDGAKGKLEDHSLGETCTEYKDSSKLLNTAKYTRYYSMGGTDAMGNSDRKRSFNDYLFAAQTTHPRVSPLEACTEVDEDGATAQDAERQELCKSFKDKIECNSHKGWTAKELDKGATSAKCVQVSYGCRYKKCWIQRWSYAMPLEIIYMTPLTNWNPYNIPYYEDNKSDDYKNVGKGNGKEGNPYRGSRDTIFFRTPADFYKDKDNANADPADTSGGQTYVQDKNGKTREVRASGHWILFPEIEGVGVVRQRYPIMPVHAEGSSIWKETKALEELVMGKESSTDIQAIFAETRSSAYGVELLLKSGGGHTHQVSLSVKEVQKLHAGETLKVLSTFDSGHAHFLDVTYDATRPKGEEYYMTWCTQTDSSKQSCPEKVKDEPTGCSSSGVSCCYGKCPDNHPGLQVIY